VGWEDDGAITHDPLRMRDGVIDNDDGVVLDDVNASDDASLLKVSAWYVAAKTPLKFHCTPKSTPAQSCVVASNIAFTFWKALWLVRLFERNNFISRLYSWNSFGTNYNENKLKLLKFVKGELIRKRPSLLDYRKHQIVTRYYLTLKSTVVTACVACFHTQ
jgi:hypothetical protein